MTYKTQVQDETISGIKTFSGGMISLGIFGSVTASASLPNLTPTTVYTFANINSRQLYHVYAHIGGSGSNAPDYIANAFIAVDGGNARITMNGSSSMTISLSGLNLQLKQVSGSTYTGYVTIMQMGN